MAVEQTTFENKNPDGIFTGAGLPERWRLNNRNTGKRCSAQNNGNQFYFP